MSLLHTPTSARGGGSRLDDPKYLFSAEARESIKRHPSMTPVPLFHHHQQHHPALASQSTSQLTSPSALSNTTSLSSSAQALDHRSLASSASYMSSGLIRPQPRSPHDADSWDGNSSLTAHSPFQQTYGAYTHYQPAHPHLSVQPPTLTPTSLPPPSPSSAPTSQRPTAPFFASLAKHSSLHLASPGPARSYLPPAVSVYGEFDAAVWQRTPLPKSLSAHPMAVAQSEARRQREEWERENKRLWELEQERAELLRRSEQRQRMQQEMHIRAMQAQDEAAQQQQQQQQLHTPVVVKRGSAAAIGSRPSLSLRRSVQSNDAGFVTPAAKPRRRPDNTSETKKRAQAAAVETDRVERKEAGTTAREEREEARQDEVSADDEDGLAVNEDEQVDEDGAQEAEEDEEEDENGNESEEQEETRADSDTEDEAEADVTIEPATEANADNEVRLSPVKKRPSNRVYTVPPRSSSTASASSPSPPPSATPLPPPPAGLKPDMSLTRWYFHIQQHNPPLPPRITIKGTHATEGAWSSGYVTDRQTASGRLLLTNSRRYVLVGGMDECEMVREGWSERMRGACVEGLPVEWKEWLVREGEQRLQEQREKEAKRVSFDFAEEEEAEEKKERAPVKEKQQEEEQREEEEPTSHKRLSPLIRARRSPAPIRHSEWWEDELMRLVEAVSMHTEAKDSNGRSSNSAGSSDGVELWKRVADEVGGGRRWEECKVKFEEVRREQSRGIKETEKKKEKEKRFEERKEERKTVEMQKASSVKKTDKTDKKESSREPATNANAHKATKRSLMPPTVVATPTPTKEKKEANKDAVEKKKKQQQQQETAEAKDDEKQPEASSSSSSSSTTTTASIKKRPAKPKSSAPSTLLSSIAPPTHTPTTPTPTVEHAVINPHDMAYTHTRRSGRAVMAPLKHWELEREVNGVILRGFQHGGEAIRRVLTEKDRMEKEASAHMPPPPQQRVEARGRVAGEGKVKKKRWSADEKEQLRLAYMWVEPSEKGFWVSVSRFMAGRTADECQAEYEKMFPTPKRRGKRKANDEADDDNGQQEEEKKDGTGKEEAKEDEDKSEAQQPRKRKRVTTIKREIRNALDSRQQQHNGDDLFDSTPYKNNTDLARTISSQQQPNNHHRTKRNDNNDPSTDAHETDGSLLFAGDPALADLHVQRIAKERRKLRAYKGKAVGVERRRQAAEERGRGLGERVAGGVSELRLGVRRLEEEDEERKQALMDEMDDEVEDDDEDEEREEEEEDEIV